MKARTTQRGALLMVAVILIVIVGFLGVVITTLFVGGLRASLDYASSGEALFLAEGGLQHGIRKWGLDPVNYLGEGPVTFGGGNFTITVVTTDRTGNPLPPGQRRVISSGRVPSVAGDALREADVILQPGPGSLLYDPFGDLSNWQPGAAPFDTTCPVGAGTFNTQGTVGHDPTLDAPGSVGGSFSAVSVAGKAGERLSGYLEHTLATAVGAGTDLVLDFAYRKRKGVPAPNRMGLAIDLVATDGTTYHPWSDCQIKNANWTQVAGLTWTVPAGTTIDRVRLVYDLENATGGGGQPRESEVGLDELQIGTNGGALVTIVSW